jgi:hypothetical protein
MAQIGAAFPQFVDRRMDEPCVGRRILLCLSLEISIAIEGFLLQSGWKTLFFVRRAQAKRRVL